MVLLGLLKQLKNSEWEAPSFAHPKPRTNWLHFLSDLVNLNTHLKRKPYPMPKMNEKFLKWEGFNYVKSLDLNMVYDHIRLIENSINLCTIILPQVKYLYKRFSGI